MRLPKDTNEWTPNHLKQAIKERDAAFARYEAKVDFNDLDASAELFAAYLRKDQVVDDLMLVCS